MNIINCIFIHKYYIYIYIYYIKNHIDSHETGGRCFWTRFRFFPERVCVVVMKCRIHK